MRSPALKKHGCENESITAGSFENGELIIPLNKHASLDYWKVSLSVLFLIFYLTNQSTHNTFDHSIRIHTLFSTK